MSCVWLTIRWIHLLAMAFFVGGQMLLAGVRAFGPECRLVGVGAGVGRSRPP